MEQERLARLVRNAMVGDWKDPPQSPSVQALLSKTEAGIRAVYERLKALEQGDGVDESQPQISLTDAYALLLAEDYTDAVITEACGALLARNIDRSTVLLGLMEAAVGIRASHVHSRRVKEGILRAAAKRAESDSHSKRVKAGIAAAKARKANP